MTREEAITNLNMISVAFVEPVTKEQRKLIDDTFEMAIQALSQEPCDDAISRKAVMDCYKKWRPYMASRIWDFEKELSELPSVNPQKSELPYRK